MSSYSLPDLTFPLILKGSVSSKKLLLCARKKAEGGLAGLMRRHWAGLYLDPLYLDTVTGDPDRSVGVLYWARLHLGPLYLDTVTGDPDRWGEEEGNMGWTLPGSSLPGYCHWRPRQVGVG